MIKTELYGVWDTLQRWRYLERVNDAYVFVAGVICFAGYFFPVILVNTLASH